MAIANLRPCFASLAAAGDLSVSLEIGYAPSLGNRPSPWSRVGPLWCLGYYEPVRAHPTQYLAHPALLYPEPLTDFRLRGAGIPRGDNLTVSLCVGIPLSGRVARALGGVLLVVVPISTALAGEAFAEYVPHRHRFVHPTPARR